MRIPYSPLARMLIIWSAAIGTSLLLRTCALLWIGGHLPSGDVTIYTNMATQLLNGDGLYTNDSVYYGKELRAAFPPLYPLFLAGAGLVGGGVTPVTTLALNSLFDCGTAAVVALVGRQVGYANAGVAAGTTYLLWPNLILYAPLAQKEALTTLLTLVIILCFVRVACLRQTRREAPAIGFATGALALTQPVLAPVALCLGVALLYRNTGALMRLAVRAAPVAVLVMLPWWIRNWLLFDRFVPLTTSMGNTLRFAVNRGHERLPSDILALPESDRSAELVARATDEILAQPMRYLKGIMKQMVEGWSNDDAVLQLVRLNHSPLPQIMQLLWIATCLLAAVSLVRNRRLLLRAVAAGLALQLAFFNLWFEFGQRHRYAILPVLLLLAFIEVSSWFRRDNNRSMRRSKSSRSSSTSASVIGERASGPEDISRQPAATSPTRDAPLHNVSRKRDRGLNSIVAVAPEVWPAFGEARKQGESSRGQGQGQG